MERMFKLFIHLINRLWMTSKSRLEEIWGLKTLPNFIEMPSLTFCLGFWVGTFKELKRGKQVSFLTPVLKLWGGGHFDGHQWRCIIVPPNLARSYSAIYAHFPSCGVLLYHNLNTSVILKSKWEWQHTLNKIAWQTYLRKNPEVQ